MSASDALSTATLLLTELSAPELSLCLERRFDRLTRVAREALRVSVAGLAVAREGRFCFKSITGWDVTELPEEQSLCQRAIATGELVLIPDLLEDPALARHPLATQPPHIRFYAGYPLSDRQGTFVATLCFFDIRPRSLSPRQLQVLRDLGEMAQRELLNDAGTDPGQQFMRKAAGTCPDAMIDSLTRLWNRQAGFQFLHEACEAGGETGSVAVAMVGLDCVGQVSELHGKAVGDEILKKVAGRLVNAVRDGDVVARYGRDRFMLVFGAIGGDELRSLMERIRQQVAEAPIRTRVGPLTVMLGTGTASAGPDTSLYPDRLVQLADAALLESMTKASQAREVPAAAPSSPLSEAEQPARRKVRPEGPTKDIARGRNRAAERASRDNRTYHRLQSLPETVVNQDKPPGVNPYDSKGKREFGWE